MSTSRGQWVRQYRFDGCNIPLDATAAEYEAILRVQYKRIEEYIRADAVADGIDPASLAFLFEEHDDSWDTYYTVTGREIKAL